jgi:ubiquinone/menaquinone biosynthesis C-methylase UbiE
MVLGVRPFRIYRHWLDPREIQEYYDRLSKSYSVLYGPEQAVKHERVLAEMGKRKYDVFVDIGCGDGVLLSKARSGSNLQVGLDFSSRMLQKARHVMEGTGNLVQCDASHLPVRDEVADCVVSISLSERENIEALASEVARISRDDATILLSVVHPSGLPSANFAELKLLDTSPFSPKETLFILTKYGRPMLKNEWRGIHEGR